MQGHDVIEEFIILRRKEKLETRRKKKKKKRVTEKAHPFNMRKMHVVSCDGTKAPNL